jgi:hypothetical protein
MRTPWCKRLAFTSPRSREFLPHFLRADHRRRSRASHHSVSSRSLTEGTGPAGPTVPPCSAWLSVVSGENRPPSPRLHRDAGVSGIVASGSVRDQREK